MIRHIDLENARILWEYMTLNEDVIKSDCILGLGSHDLNVAEYSADLFLQGYSDKIIFSGGSGKLTAAWNMTEAEIFKTIAIKKGVPENSIYVETQSHSLGDNFQLTDDLIHEKGLIVNTLIVVTKPAAQRRVRATFDKQMPRYKAVITAPKKSFNDYLKFYYMNNYPIEDIICALVGDIQRLIVYYEKGFQTFVNVPIDIMKVYYELVEAGFNKYVI